MGMFRACLIFLPLFAVISPVQARHWAIRDVFLERHSADDFRRLSQCFSSQPPRPRHTTIRTDDAVHEGLYAVLFLNHSTENLPIGTTFLWEFLLDGEPKGFGVFGAIGNERGRGRELWIGLTDDEHRHLTSQKMVAWKITLFVDGKTICSRKSFLFPEQREAKYTCHGDNLTQEEITER
jgi:hypothetical protein